MPDILSFRTSRPEGPLTGLIEHPFRKEGISRTQIFIKRNFTIVLSNPDCEFLFFGFDFLDNGDHLICVKLFTVYKAHSQPPSHTLSLGPGS